LKYLFKLHFGNNWEAIQRHPTGMLGQLGYELDLHNISLDAAWRAGDSVFVMADGPEGLLSAGSYIADNLGGSLAEPDYDVLRHQLETLEADVRGWALSAPNITNIVMAAPPGTFDCDTCHHHITRCEDHDMDCVWRSC
jgi:hypothetical protein